jgi:hypothetical protein
VPNGSKIAVLELGEETTQISLMNLKFMEAGRKGGALDLVWTNGKYLTAGDTIGSNSNYRYCDYVNIVGQEYILVDGYFGEDNGLHFYASDKSVIKFVSSKTIGIVGQTYGTKILVPEGAVYVRMSGTISAELNIVIQGKRGFTYTSLPKLEFLRIENCSQLNPFTMLKSIYNTDGNVIRDIRIIGFDVDGDASDVTMIANLANDVDKDGNSHVYNGIDAEGKPMDNSHPIIEGRLRVNGNIYEEDYLALKAVFSNLAMEFLGFYVSFKDPEVLRVLLANIKTDDGVGLTIEDIEGVTNISTWFRANKVIETFDELERFTGLTYIYGMDSTNEVYGAFENCSSLVRVSLPPNVSALRGHSFEDCVNLREVKNLEQISVLGSRAFYGCTSLEQDIYMPLLTALTFDGGFYNYRYFANSGITGFFAPNLTQGQASDSGDHLSWFSGCTKLKRVNLGKVDKIPNRAFMGCSALEEVEGLQDVITISPNAFEGCSSLVQDIKLPKCTSILSNAGYINVCSFRNSGITSIEAPMLTSLGNGSNSSAAHFTGCTNLKRVKFDVIAQIGNYAFYGCAALEQVYMPLVQTIGQQAFYNCTALEFDELRTPNLTSLGTNAFYNVKIKKWLDMGKITSMTLAGAVKTALEELVIPETVTTIGANVLENCSALTSLVVDLPNLTGTIGNYAFKGNGLAEVNNLGTVTALGAEVFMNCKNLKHIVLPETLASISTKTFQGCTALEYVVVKATTPPSLASTTAFTSTNDCPIYVPDSSVEAYRTATNWSAYASRIYPISMW